MNWKDSSYISLYISMDPEQESLMNPVKEILSNIGANTPSTTIRLETKMMIKENITPDFIMSSCWRRRASEVITKWNASVNPTRKGKMPEALTDPFPVNRNSQYINPRMIVYKGTKYGLSSMKKLVFDVTTFPPEGVTLKATTLPPQIHVARTCTSS